MGIGHHGIYSTEFSKWALADENDSPITDYKYNYVTEWGEGYFKAEIGAKKNILRPDGSEVLAIWFTDVFKVKKGFFIIGITKRKTATTPTKYLYGLAHISGTIIFPPIFNKLFLEESKEEFFYAELDGKPYIITTDGSIYDPQQSHLPKQKVVDIPDFFEKAANWILPGLQFFYRDTDFPFNPEQAYKVGDVIRAGFYVDATTKLLKPAAPVRYIIASAHAALFFEIDDLCQKNPDVKKWNLVTFHKNSYFKVMDIYKKDGVTQIFLLHIPESVARYLGDNVTMFNFIDGASGQETSLVEMSRCSLDEKLRDEIHQRSLDEVFKDRTYWPVGLDNHLLSIPLPPDNSFADGKEEALSSFIHSAAKDEDITLSFTEKDSFPYRGIVGTKCEGCIYSSGIVGNGEGCGRLFKNEFRERYMAVECIYRKEAINIPSEFERKKTREQAAARDKIEKTTTIYARKLVRDFIKEKLNGSIDNLKFFELSSIREDPKFGGHTYTDKSNILYALMTLIFGDVWGGMDVFNLEKYEFQCTHVNQFQNLFGSNIMGEYLMGLQKYDVPEPLHKRALKVASLTDTIGNFMVWPSKASFQSILEASPNRRFMDRFLLQFKDVLCGEKKVNMDLKAAIYKNRAWMDKYTGEEGIKSFIKDMMLEDFTDENGLPKEVFDPVWLNQKDFNRDLFIKAVEKYCSFCESFIPRRADRILDKLKIALMKDDPKRPIQYDS